MYYDKLKNNPVISYRDLEQALYDTIQPYFAYVSPGCSRIAAGPSAATFNNKAVELEGFARLLWGVIPYLKGQALNAKPEGAKSGILRAEKTPDESDIALSEFIVMGITNGVDPDHEEFWGIPGDYDQLLVEMAVFGYALLLIPGMVWDPLSKKTKQQFAYWLSYINRRQIPDCNWVFFRILVNCGLERVGAAEFNRKMLEESFGLVDEFYVSGPDDGWYNDGKPAERRSRDYYIPWAMHYYGLIFSGCCADSYPEYAAKYRQRALQFSNEFSYWFADDGAPLPYGRSLTYRYAQCAFWGALPFAISDSTADLPWGEFKGYFLRNLRWWFGQAAYTETGRMTVGYTYPNQYMAERYNSPNSPLWALKAFIPLSLAESHPFWQAEEEAARINAVSPRGAFEECYSQRNTGFIICLGKNAGHLYALSNGQWTPGAPNEHLHMAEKYAKFAYSSYFGFNVVTDTYGLDKLAVDNMLLLSGGDEYYRYRTSTIEHETADTYVYSKWKPFDDVEVETWLSPCNKGQWQLRVHRIVSERPLKAAEGGFPLPYGDTFYPLPGDDERVSYGQSEIVTAQGCSRIVDAINDRTGLLVISSPNSNIMHPRVAVPTLQSEHSPGEFWLACFVQADPRPDVLPEIPQLKEALASLPDKVQQDLMKTGEMR